MKKILNKSYRIIRSHYEIIKNYKSRIKWKHHNSIESGITHTKYNEKKIIISFTTIPERLDNLMLTLETLMEQSLKPNKIILYIYIEQFKDIDVEEILGNFIKRGLEVKRVSEDLRAHKKYFYSFQEFPNDLIITVDDDILYSKKMVELLYKGYQKYPNCIICMRAHGIKYSQNHFEKYWDWEYEVVGKKTPKMDLIATGGAGTLYEPKQFSNEIYNKKNIIKLSLSADDLWLKAMQIINNIKVVKVTPLKGSVTVIIGSQEVALVNENVYNNQNDKVLSDLNKEYKLLQKLIKYH